MDKVQGQLQEECAEVIQAVSKLNRFGAQNLAPNGQTNQLNIESELGDVLAVVAILSYRGSLNWDNVLDSACLKARQLGYPAAMNSIMHELAETPDFTPITVRNPLPHSLALRPFVVGPR